MDVRALGPEAPTTHKLRQAALDRVRELGRGDQAYMLYGFVMRYPVYALHLLDQLQEQQRKHDERQVHDQ